MKYKTYNMQNSIRWIIGLIFVGAAVYGNSYFYQEPLLYRVIGVIVVSGLGLFILTTTLEGKEALKTVIDSRTETTQTTLIVLVAITIAALILWGLDSLFGWATAALLG